MFFLYFFLMEDMISGFPINEVSKAVVQPLCITAKALLTQAVIDPSRITCTLGMFS